MEINSVSLPRDPLMRRLEKMSDASIESNSFSQGVYLDTNEDGLESAATRLAERGPASARSIHIGFSGLYNFDLIALRKSRWALICDINPDNCKVVKLALRLLQESSISRIDFPKRLRMLLKECSVSCWIVDPDLDRESCWLANEESFKYIRNLALGGKITAITVDIRTVDTYRRIGSLLRDNGIIVDSLYLSDIGHYMKEKDDREAMTQTVAALSERDTQVIYVGKDCFHDLPQRVVPYGVFAPSDCF